MARVVRWWVTCSTCALCFSLTFPMQDEALVMFWTIELLRTVEYMHRCGILHGNITLSSILLRNDVSSDDTVSQAAWNRHGSQGWAAKGEEKSVLIRHCLNKLLP